MRCSRRRRSVIGFQIRRRAMMRSDAFGCVRMRSDTFAIIIEPPRPDASITLRSSQIHGRSTNVMAGPRMARESHS